MMDDKAVLITQLRLAEYAGSEITTLELVEYFSKRARSVHVVTALAKDPMSSEFQVFSNVSVHNIKDDLSALADNIDIAWIQHQMIPDTLLDSTKPIYYIFNHMSSSIGVEQVLFPQIERTLADKILFNSQETLDTIKNRGMLEGVTEGTIEVFNNPAPAQFIDKTSIKKLDRILVVSNHVPKELEKAISELRNQGITVSRFGIEAEDYRRILPDDIFKHDAVISIGKTVQYAILAQRPVYCYDKFGGPGYLLKDNYELAKENNFSGRGFDKKKPEEITREMIEQFQPALEFVKNIGGNERENLTLETRMDALLSEMLLLPPHSKSITGVDKEVYVELRNLIYEKFPIMHHYNSLRKKPLILEEKVAELQKSLDEAILKYNEVVLSNSYKIGRLLTLPVRFFKKLKRKLGKKLVMTKNITRVIKVINTTYGLQLKSILRKPKISLVVRSIEHPTSSTFIRMISPLSVLSAKHNNLSVELVDGDRPKIANLANIVIVQRTALIDLDVAKNLVDQIKKKRSKLYVDTDDAFSSIDTNHPQYELQKDRIQALDYILKEADVVWVSTKKLQDAYKSFRAEVVYNTIDEKVWTRLKEGRAEVPEKDSPLEIVYMGTKTHDGDFGLVLPALKRLYSLHPGEFRLHVIGVANQEERYPWLVVHDPPDGLYPNFVKWFSELGPFDIGISPLEDTAFNQNKSDIKCLDYLAVGAKPVVSDVEAYKNPDLNEHILRVKNSEEEWLSALEQELKKRNANRKKAHERIASGYEYIRKNRTPKVAADKMGSFLGVSKKQ